MKKIVILAAVFLTAFQISVLGQGSTGSEAKYEYRSLIDLPTAGILEKGYVGVNVDVIPVGVVITKIDVGVFKNFCFGISYGGSNIIGTGKVDWYKLPGVNIRVRILDETFGMPALALGFDSQGKGRYIDSTKRFEIKSPGFFAAVAKNFEFLGYLSLHGVVNYSLEREDGDKDLNLGIGIEKTIGSAVSLVAEYDFAINDNSGKAIGEGSGYLNVGVRWAVDNGFTIGLDLRNLITNKKFTSNKADRAIFIEYIKAIFNCVDF